MLDLTPITLEVRPLDGRMWDIFNKQGPLTDEELAYLDEVEAAYVLEFGEEEGALRQGYGKPGQDDAVYDGEKIVFFGQRIIERAKL